MKRIVRSVMFIVVCALMLNACAPATPPPTAPPAAQPTAVPPTTAPTKAPQPTAVPPTVAPTKPPAPTVAPTAAAPAVDPNKKLKLVMVQHALCAWDSFWCVVQKGIETAAKQMNIEVTVLGPDKFDLEKTASLIDQATAGKPDGIALTVTDAKLFKDPINRAIKAGIPVVAYNAGSGPDKDGIPYLTYIGQDEYQGGYLGGLRMIAAGGKKGVCINQQVGHAGLDLRCKGFVDAFASKNLKAAVLGITDDPAQSQTTISDYATANADVDAFLTLGPNGANPFYAWLKASGKKAGEVKHGTFDLSPEIVNHIEDGSTLFGIDQQPFLQGYNAVMSLALLLRQNVSPALPVTATGPGFVDKTNVPFVKALAGQYR